jgi:Flp pilus assembly protein TadG
MRRKGALGSSMSWRAKRSNLPSVGLRLLRRPRCEAPLCIGPRNDMRFRGAALAEAAIVMMVLCLVTLGALQYGWFFYCLHTATNAARQGARVQATLDAPAGSGTAALQALLPNILKNAATVKDVQATTVVGEDGHAVEAFRGEVLIPNSSTAVRLLPLAFLPVPDLHAAVTMAKEGAS